MSNFEPISHDEAQELLPWLVNNSLEPNEYERVREHAASCITCRRELDELERLQTTVLSSDDSRPVAAPDMQYVNARIDAMLAREDRRDRLKSSVLDFVRQPWRVAFAAQSVLVVGLISILFWSEHEAANFATLTSPESLPDGEYIRVVFDPDASPAAIDAMLDQLGLSLIAGPSERGVATLRPATLTSVSERHMLVAELLDQPGVLFAQPVSQGNQ